MNSLSFQADLSLAVSANPKHAVPARGAIKSAQSRALIHQSAGAPIAAPDELRRELELRGTGRPGTDSLD
jgi:hypothetical protein